MHWQFINKTVIGNNNLSLVTFDWGSSNQKVIHFGQMLLNTPILNLLVLKLWTAWVQITKTS